MSRTRHSPFRLQRFARSRCARLLAYVAAVLLFLTNFSAWAMPAAHGTEQPAAQAMASDSAHHHCDEAGAKKNTGAEQMAPHGKGCPCCLGAACACLQSCSGALIAISSDLVPPASMQSLPPLDTSFIDATGERRLRPPIG